MLFLNDNKAKMCLSCVFVCVFRVGVGEGGITTENCQKIDIFLYKSALFSLEQKRSKFIQKAAQLVLSYAFSPFNVQFCQSIVYNPKQHGREFVRNVKVLNCMG